MKRQNAGFTLTDLIVLVLIAGGYAVLLIQSSIRSRCGCGGGAGSALKQLVTHESVWRTQDTDKNGVADYWTRDVAGFHGVRDANNQAVAFIDLAFARADRAPGAAYPELADGQRPKQGYFFQAMLADQDGFPYLQADSPVARAWGAPVGVCTHQARFGFTALPGQYGVDGILVYIVGEDGVVWQKDLGEGVPVLDRRLAAPPGSDATWAQFGG